MNAPCPLRPGKLPHYYSARSDCLSQDLELRIFEVGWSGRVIFVEQPIFLVPNPAALCRKWMETQSLEGGAQ